ncbi:MAG: IS200/IS605 family transposase [Anaerolineales bacterium]|jgi:putative transposase
MRSPYTQLYLHCVWATWDRLPLITPLNEQSIYASILSKGQGLKCNVLALGGTSDHIHLLVRFSTTITVANLVKEIKGASSHLVTHQVTAGEFFKWQGAYGAFTVSKNLVSVLKTYIEHQKQHHASNDLQPDWEQITSRK